MPPNCDDALQNDLSQQLDAYAAACIELSIQAYYSVSNPSLGHNIDVGEKHSFDIRVHNKGGLAIENLTIQIDCIHGEMSQTYVGASGVVSVGWGNAWNTSITIPYPRVGPHENILIGHPSGGPHLFGYHALEETGGSDNDRDREDLITATLKYATVRLDRAVKVLGNKAVYNNFIQRT